MRKNSAKVFDAKFDAGEDISDVVDRSKMAWPGRETRRVNVDFPAWVVEALDREARRLGSPDRRWSSFRSPSDSARRRESRRRSAEAHLQGEAVDQRSQRRNRRRVGLAVDAARAEMALERGDDGVGRGS